MRPEMIRYLRNLRAAAGLLESLFVPHLLPLDLGLALVHLQRLRARQRLSHLLQLVGRHCVRRLGLDLWSSYERVASREGMISGRGWSMPHATLAA